MFILCYSCEVFSRKGDGHKRNKKRGKPGTFYDVPISKIQKNTFTRSQDERPSIKCVSKGRGHRACGRDLFPTGKGKFFLFPALHRFHFF